MTRKSASVRARTPGLSSDEHARVLQVDRQALEADGVSALDDQVRLDLAASEAPARHLVCESAGGHITGYAHADLRPTDAVVAHLVVAPASRLHGVGTALLAELDRVRPELPLRVWAHGDTPGAQAMAARHGFRRVRELRQLRLVVRDAPLSTPSYPEQTTVRPFVPGVDDEAWVAVNAAAFRHHPEQGRLSVDDLRQRLAQPWFDAAGFFVAERAGGMVGYHWTKTHPSERPGRPEPVGEVYVLGVHPDAQGLGLGRALTLTGLLHLRQGGLDEVMLYVESDNLPAIAVYERLGFTTASVDVMYAR